MSEKPWQEQLRQTVAGLQANNNRPRVAVVGVGHELRGDDAAGVALIRLLERWVESPFLQVVEAGSAPENCCGLLFQYRPDLVLFVDAADMAEEPGTIRWLTWPEVVGFGVSTHTLPLPLLANYLAVELGCPVRLLGIQPAGVSIGAPLSPPVIKAVGRIAREMVDMLTVAEGAAV